MTNTPTEVTNNGIFVNAGRPIDENWDFYLFGGFTRKEVIGGIFSRAAARTDRSALDIFPNGFNPETPANLDDFQLVTGARGVVGQDWLLDFSIGYSGNNLLPTMPAKDLALITFFKAGQLLIKISLDQIVLERYT